MIEKLKIRSANPTDADELFAIRRDAIMALAEEYGRVAAERWASAAPPDRAAKAIATNSVWVTECGSMVVGWVEVSGATIESLYVSSAAARRGVGSSLLAHAERQIRAAGALGLPQSGRRGLCPRHGPAVRVGHPESGTQSRQARRLVR